MFKRTAELTRLFMLGLFGTLAWLAVATVAAGFAYWVLTGSHLLEK